MSYAASRYLTLWLRESNTHISPLLTTESPVAQWLIDSRIPSGASD